MITVGSLFTGIGGIDLGFVQAGGYDIRFQVEIDPFCRQVIRHHRWSYWPNSILHKDVRNVGSHNLPSVDVMAGGFPCQDISAAGRGAGIAEGTRSGLWFEFARIIGELRPRVVLLENVQAITSRGGARVIADLAKIGYDAQWTIIRASDVGAPHERARWFCVAYPCRIGRGRDDGLDQGREPLKRGREVLVKPASFGLSKPRKSGCAINTAPSSDGQADCSGDASARGTQSGVDRDVFDGLSVRLDGFASTMPWAAGQGPFQYDYEPSRASTDSFNRQARNKAIGNAVVVPIVRALAEQIRDAFFAEETCNLT